MYLPDEVNIYVAGKQIGGVTKATIAWSAQTGSYLGSLEILFDKSLKEICDEFDEQELKILAVSAYEDNFHVVEPCKIRVTSVDFGIESTENIPFAKVNFFGIVDVD